MRYYNRNRYLFSNQYADNYFYDHIYYSNIGISSLKSRIILTLNPTSFSVCEIRQNYEKDVLHSIENDTLVINFLNGITAYKLVDYYKKNIICDKFIKSFQRYIIDYGVEK